MLIGLLLSGNLSGFGTAAATTELTPAGGSLGRSAQHEWESRAYWRKQAKRFLDDEDATPPQAAQDAPTQPRTAGPALTLTQLLDRTEGTPAGDTLTRALAYGNQARIAQAAYQAARLLARNNEALALLLVLH